MNFPWLHAEETPAEQLTRLRTFLAGSGPEHRHVAEYPIKVLENFCGLVNAHYPHDLCLGVWAEALDQAEHHRLQDEVHARLTAPRVITEFVDGETLDRIDTEQILLTQIPADAAHPGSPIEASCHEYYQVKVGDICHLCGDAVAPKWSGIACPCGHTWFCCC